MIDAVVNLLGQWLVGDLCRVDATFRSRADSDRSVPIYDGRGRKLGNLRVGPDGTYIDAAWVRTNSQPILLGRVEGVKVEEARLVVYRGGEAMRGVIGMMEEGA